KLWIGVDLWGALYIGIATVGIGAVLDGRHWIGGLALAVLGVGGVVYQNYKLKDQEYTLFHYVAVAAAMITWGLILSDVYFSSERIYDHQTMLSQAEEIAQIRKDLDHYAMPRHLTDAQKADITAYLSDPSHPPQTVRMVVLKDSEAIDYGNDWSDALQAAHWNIQPVQVNASEFVAKFGEVTNGNLEGMLCGEYWSCDPGSSGASKAAQFLSEASEHAKIHPPIGCSGGCTKDPSRAGATLLFGYRPRTWHPEMKEVPAE